MNIDNIIHLLIILGLANGAPILATRIFAGRFAFPVDAGYTAADGYRYLGDSKSWRGIVSAFLLAMPVALWLGLSWFDAAMVIVLSMCGDLCASFIKRRRGLVSSCRAIGLDQIPEAGLPVIYLWLKQTLTLAEGVSLVVSFMMFEIVVSKLLFQLHIRKRPY